CPSLSQFKNGEDEQLSPFKRKLSCNKGYTLYGPQYIYCTDRGVWIPEVPSCIKSGCPYLPINQNVRVSEGKQKGSMKSYFCNPSFILSGADRVLCDGTRWSGVSPNCVKYDTLTRNFTCDFEDKGFCGWIQDINDDFDWTRWSGKTLSDETGPSSDHTGNPNGHYIYIETTDMLRNSKAILMSPTFLPYRGINKCVEFWYHSFGRNAGALRVHLKPIPAKGKPLVIFDRDGLNNDTWFRGFAEIRAQQYTYNILFEATVGGAYGDIALDDINIYNCKVPTRPPVKGVTPATRKTQTLTQSKVQLPTAKPTTTKPTTAKPTTTKLTTAVPMTAEPTTAEPITSEPTTAEPKTAEPTTEEPTTAEPTTEEPTSAEPAQTSASSTETASMEIASTDGIITLSLPTVTTINNITTPPMVTDGTTKDTLMVSLMKEDFSSFVGSGDDTITEVPEPTYFWTTGPDETPSSENTPVPTMDILRYTTENTNSEDSNNIVDNSKISNTNDNEAPKSKSKEKPGRHPAYVAGLIGSVLAVIIAVIILVIGIRKWNRKRQSSSAVKEVNENELNEILVNDSKPDTSTPPENPSDKGNVETTLKADLEATNNPKPDTSPPPENPSDKESVEKEEANSKSDKDINNGSKETQTIDNREDDNAKKTLGANTNEEFKTNSNEIVTENITPDTEAKIIDSTTISSNVEALLSSGSKDNNAKERDKENKAEEKTDLTSTADGNVEDKNDEKKIDKTDSPNTEDKIPLLETHKKSNDHKFSMFKKLFRNEDAKSAKNKNPDSETAGTSKEQEQKEETANTISVDERVSSQQSNDVENVVVQKAEGQNDKLASVEGQDFQLPKAEGQNVEMPKEEGQHVESSKYEINKDNTQKAPMDKKANEKHLKKIKKDRENEEKRRKQEEKKKKKEESKAKKDKTKKDVSKAKDEIGEWKDVSKAKDEIGEWKDVSKAKDEIGELQTKSLQDKNIETKDADGNALTAQTNIGLDDQCVEIQKEEKSEREAVSSITLGKNDQVFGITTNLFDLINNSKDPLIPEITNQDDNQTPGEGASIGTPSDADMTLTHNDTIVVRF
ncbi:proteoglycan 4, partial [Biomphalaria pfeifferi]